MLTATKEMFSYNIMHSTFKIISTNIHSGSTRTVKDRVKTILDELK